jgi:hypothetical protein
MKLVLVLTTEAVDHTVIGEVAAFLVVEVADPGGEDSEDIESSGHYPSLESAPVFHNFVSHYLHTRNILG